ncbi:MAG: D-alanine--D-alanine ligase [Acidobacteriota bacterium]
MKKQRVLVLMHRDLVPPAEAGKIEDYTREPWKTEYDVTVTIEDLGHDVKPLGVYGDLGVLHKAIQEWEPTIVFNLLEEFGGEAMLDQNVVSYLEMLNVRHTGCNPLGMMLARDKALSKKLLTYHKIRVPRFQVFPRDRTIRRVRALPFPIFLKSLVEDASLGISRQSIVEDDKSLVERVGFIHEKIRTDAIGEQYIPGRDLYVAVMGNRRLTVFPPMELDIKKQGDDLPVIATRKVKFDRKYQKEMGVQTTAAKLSPELLAHVQRISRRIFKILNLNGYARMDFRLTEDGQLFFLEANPNPELAYGEDFAESAEKAGVGYEDLVLRILHLGLTWKREL